MEAAWACWRLVGGASVFGYFRHYSAKKWERSCQKPHGTHQCCLTHIEPFSVSRAACLILVVIFLRSEPPWWVFLCHPFPQLNAEEDDETGSSCRTRAAWQGSWNVLNTRVTTDVPAIDLEYPLNPSASYLHL